MFGALRSHKFYVPLITVAVSVGLFMVYYFFYVARERNDANERAFRLLGVVDSQLVQQYTDLGGLFGAALVAPTANAGSTTKGYLERAFGGEISDIQVNKECDGITKRDGKMTLELVTDAVGGLSLRATFKPTEPEGYGCSLSAT